MALVLPEDFGFMLLRTTVYDIPGIFVPGIFRVCVYKKTPSAQEVQPLGFSLLSVMASTCIFYHQLFHFSIMVIHSVSPTYTHYIVVAQKKHT